jgi:hypothetical protein
VAMNDFTMAHTIVPEHLRAAIPKLSQAFLMEKTQLGIINQDTLSQTMPFRPKIFLKD